MQDAQPPAIVDAGALDSLDQVETDHLSMQAAALDWLKTKAARSESKKTLTAYRTTLGQFDAYLQGQGCTLDADPRRVARYAQEWAFHTERNAPLSSSTINQRFAILSSFYKFAVKYGACEKNPIEYTERPPRHIEHAAPYLDDDYVSQQMQGIDTRTPEGKRDKALISLALTTGRRASELTGLCWKDLELRGKRMVAHWRCKGKKTMRDQLQARTIAVLLEYLQAEYGANLQRIKPESPVFVSYSNNHRGGPLSIQAVSDIYKKRLGVTQIHVTRHTFARNMEEAGASLSEIGERLGHSNYQVTAQYMKRLHSSENQYASKLEELFSI